MASNMEVLLETLIDGEAAGFTPTTRAEKYLKNCIDACGCEGLPTPQSRMDALLYALAGELEGGGEQPQLYAPTASIDGDTLTITDENNGAFVTSYDLYVDGEKQATIE